MWLNRIAVVTGASADIGAAIVKDCISAGINVVRLDKSITNLKQKLEESLSVGTCIPHPNLHLEQSLKF